MEHEQGISPGEVGLLYMTTALPSVIASKYAGDLGNQYGRANVLLFGMVQQGLFFMLGPKDLIWVEVIFDSFPSSSVSWGPFVLDHLLSGDC